MQDYNTKMPKVKTINGCAYREIDEIRVKLNALASILNDYNDQGVWVDPDGDITFALEQADDYLAEATCALERMGAR